MSAIKIAAVVLIVAGVLGLVYGSFSYKVSWPQPVQVSFPAGVGL